MITGVMATFPARERILGGVVERVAAQVDRLYVVLNEYAAVPRCLADFENVTALLPDTDWKDVGKFAAPTPAADDFVFLFDDDIDYPDNYARRMLALFRALPMERKVLGLHGVIYSDFFDGDQGSRCVYPFFLGDEHHRLVNQLGTGTVLCRGVDLPPLEYMRGSERFVDVRFARYQHERGVPLISVARDRGWLQQIEPPEGESIFTGFTLAWPAKVTREARTFGGFARMDPTVVRTLRDWEASTRLEASA